MAKPHFQPLSPTDRHAKHTHEAQIVQVMLKPRGSTSTGLTPTSISETMSSEFCCLAGRHLSTSTLIQSTCVCVYVCVCVFGSLERCTTRFGGSQGSEGEARV